MFKYVTVWDADNMRGMNGIYSLYIKTLEIPHLKENNDYSSSI